MKLPRAQINPLRRDHCGYLVVIDRDQIAAPMHFKSEWNSLWAYEQAVRETSRHQGSVVSTFSWINRLNPAGVTAAGLETVMVNEGEKQK